MKSEKYLVVIAGPTAVGKTAIAIELAKFLETEVVSADSRQIFREMNIGTAKPSAVELAQVKHHFINTHSIHELYDAKQFADDALKVIADLFLTRKFVIMCGGSGLYIKGVCEGFDEIPQVDPEIRESLVRSFEINGLAWLQNELQELDPSLYAVIDQQNPHRLIRALEVRIGTGQSISTFRNNKKHDHNFTIVKIGLELERDTLYERIDNRMDIMIQSGLVEEAKQLYPYQHLNALQTVGYQEIFDFIDGKTDYEETVRLLKRNSRRYAKRQLTWFKRDEEMKWFNPADISVIKQYIGLTTSKT